jgi:glycolate oxidase FAD binding subunit
MVATDSTDSLLARVRHAIEHRSPLLIEGGGSKRFYGYPATSDSDRLDMAAHQGVIDYSPDELVIRVRAGTLLSDINRLLRDNGQMLPFEPPGFTRATTIGGVIASGLSGPRRPWAGSARDFVLGVKLITGRGEALEFGGQVMKNVAGYDVSRLVTGSLGTLGVILDVSLKVLPAPELEVTRVLAIKRQEFQSHLQSIQRQIPLSAASHQDGYLKLRLSGSEAAVNAATKITGGEETGNDGWNELNELTCFTGINNLWRVSVAPASKLFLDEAVVIDWGGGVRWLADPGYDPREALSVEDGHATLMKYDTEMLVSGMDIFQPLSEPLLGIHQRLKQQFDPAGIFNPGRMYREI